MFNVNDIIKQYTNDKENIIVILKEIQNINGYISQNDIKQLSDYFKIKENEILAIIKFNKNLTLNKKGKILIRVCNGPNCVKKGSISIKNKIEKILNIKEGQTTEDGKFTLETINCFKKCGNAPNVEIDGHLYSNITEKEIISIINKL